MKSQREIDQNDRKNAILGNEERTTVNREKAESMLRLRVMPAFARIQDDLHRPDQQQTVVYDETSPTSAELSVSGRQVDTGGGAKPAETLRYALKIAYGSQSLAVRRTVNGKEGGFHGQSNYDSLSTSAIVDDIQRSWRKAQNP